MTMEILQILAKESYNTNRIYLYEEDEKWYAYEQSAHYIRHIVSSVQLSKQVYDPYAIVVIKAEIGKEIPLNENWEIVSCSDTELEFAYRPQFKGA